MQNTKFAVGLKMTLTVFTVTLMANTVALGQTAATLFDFTPATATQPELGTIPYGGLVGDASGNLYGTTSYGGKYGEGRAAQRPSRGR